MGEGGKVGCSTQRCCTLPLLEYQRRHITPKRHSAIGDDDDFEASHVELGRTSPSQYFKMTEACRRDEISCKNEPIIHNMSHLVSGLLVTVTQIIPDQDLFLN